MALRVDEITSYEDMVPLGPVCLEAFDEPLNSWWEAVKGPSADEMVNRYWSQHESMPGSHWIKVTDLETGEILGAAEWVIHEKNPYETSRPNPKAMWWPEGDMQHISNQFLDIFFGERAKRMQQPHLLLRLCCVSQTARRRGVGSKIMELGCALADSRGLDVFIESTQAGIHPYSKFGFVSIGHFFLTAHSEDPSAEWLELYKRIAPAPFRVEVMLRPKSGKLEPNQEAA